MIGPALEAQHIELVSAQIPDYTVHLDYDARDRMWAVVVTVTATGQELRCRYYADPRNLDISAIAARLYGMRRRG